ncbi:RIP metalloprotease RseP [Luteolibacter pohnpeiensis]|uniref:Zinc metalloprotease n=1 Tax=Luteolibacter pohnpeiensis TaxID=454153 RepID=A0A934S6S6_9BACT|nr:RIP metalloprotease RseP [Luteolibacter pohnpeiensis]MBK1882315.1 RIP metalloprotease RseP [Luteolibacter pohnpeiensis]
MAVLTSILYTILLIGVVLMLFNIIIFVHELGHFLAGRWRGLQIDRFQIWFGKPIWKKTINGVQYGLGWIPAGGFVALPQMAPMESIEGGNLSEKPLPPISPLDKIIVAFAGPLFSIMLAFVAACVVWGVGKPKDVVPSQIVGRLEEKGPAARAGIKLGDKIIAINGTPVDGFQGTLNSIQENIVLSEGNEIVFTVLRDGNPEPLKITSRFETEPTKWFQRAGLRQVGIGPEADHIEVASITPGSPGEKAGFKSGDKLLTINGREFKSSQPAIAYINEIGAHPMEFVVLRDKAEVQLTATPQVPVEPKGKGPMLGILFSEIPDVNFDIVHPSPISQISDTVKMMWTTITSVASRKSSIGVQHLSGPVGIATLQYHLLQTDEGWRRILSFMVLFNVNLAILNMLPLPVLDGGHITLAILEKICGRPVQAKPLEIIQTGCALALISLMLYVTSKDIGDNFGNDGPTGVEKIVFPE